MPSKILVPEDQPRIAPEPTLRRLPVYLRHLKEHLEGRREFVSCTDIGQALKLEPTQVRKDLEVTGIVGRPRRGYRVDDLIAAVEGFLGFNNVNEAFLVGAGSLGAALLGYRRFEEYGLHIVAAFDSDPQKAGTTIHDKPVLDLDRLSDLARRMHVLIGVVTVPSEAAQVVADAMVEGGIRAIWNFAPVRLKVPDSVIVHNEDLYGSLASLSQKLGKMLRAEHAHALHASPHHAAPDSRTGSLAVPRAANLTKGN